MAAKKSMKESRGRKWSENEFKEFASVLADDRTEFALTLETLALKKSANVHIFETIKKELDARVQAKATTSSKSCYIEFEQFVGISRTWSSFLAPF